MTDNEETTMPQISIIMPLYNAAKYLEESINCVLNQTFTAFELICVNDASTDATPDILCDFARRDSRIKVLENEKRSGAAYSRNKGMREACGKYLSFLDGDDIFEEEMLERAYEAAERYRTDVIVFEMKHCTNEEIHRKQNVIHGVPFRERYCTEPFAVTDQMSYECMNWKLGPTNKLYNREFIVSNQLEFQNLSCENDAYFVFMALVLAKRLLCLNDDRVMIYARDHFEPSRISCDRDPACSYAAFLHIAEELTKREKFSEVYQQFYYQFFFSVRNSLFKCKSEEKEREYYRFLKEEGIDNILSFGAEYYDSLEDYIKVLLEQFKKQEFDTKWYREEQGLLIQLSQKQNADAVRELFAYYKAENKPVGVWGAGANGISLLKFCRDNGLEINMVIDKSPAKQGKLVSGYSVSAPEAIENTLKAVVVTPRHIFESVRQELAGREIELIDMNQYLKIY